MVFQHFRFSASSSPHIGVKAKFLEEVLPARTGSTFSQIERRAIYAKTNFAPINLSICCMPPKLEVKNLRKYVYYCYRWLPWTTWTMYPTSFWWHLHVCDIMLVTFWCIQHDFNRIFYIWASFSHYFYENVLPAKAGSTFSKADFCQHLVQSKVSIPKMASKPSFWGGDSLPWPLWPFKK